MANNWLTEAQQMAKRYAEELKKQNQYLIDQQNAAKQNSISSLENERLNAINNLNSGKETVRQTALDNAKQANINRLLSLKDNQGAMSRAGLSTQGIVGSQVNSINNNYGTALNNVLKSKAQGLQDIDSQINTSNLQYDTNRNNLVNQYDSNIASLQKQIDSEALNQYNTEVSRILALKQQEYENQQAEAARQEQIRQYNASLASQRSQTQTQSYNFSDGSSSTRIKTNYYEGEINPDTKYGTFGTTDKNGVKYQPDNVGGNKLSGSGFKVKDLFGQGNTGQTGANIDNQKIWRSTDGKFYIWDGSVNRYIDRTIQIQNAILTGVANQVLDPKLASKYL